MIENGTIDDLYFEWLYSQVASVRNRNPERSYWELCRQLYVKPFIWYIPNDDNREEDGKCLREEFVELKDIQDVEPLWMSLECSMLEMFIGLARLASFESSLEPAEWFWKFLENLGLTKYTDATYTEDDIPEIDMILERVINRTYKRNGDGGVFPLNKPKRDQRKVELWYQLSAYLLEGGYIDS